MASEVPAWLAPHLRAGEEVRWVHEPGPAAWRRAIIRIVIGAYLTFWIGWSNPSWWQYLPVWPEHVVSPVIGAIVTGLGFLGSATDTVLKHRYTGFAASDKRFLRVPLEHPLSGVLPPSKADAWPLDAVRLTERKRRDGRSRVRIEVHAPTGKRLARFRLDVGDEKALDAALHTALAQVS